LGSIEKLRRRHIVKHHLSPDEVKQGESIGTTLNFSQGVVVFPRNTNGAGMEDLSPDGRSPLQSVFKSPEKKTPFNKKNQHKDLYLSTAISTGQALQSDRLDTDNSPLEKIGLPGSNDRLLTEDSKGY
jgi:hypothetical protein